MKKGGDTQALEEYEMFIGNLIGPDALAEEKSMEEIDTEESGSEEEEEGDTKKEEKTAKKKRKTINWIKD